MLPVRSRWSSRARSLHGKQVLVTFLVAKPPYSEKGITVVGAVDLPDGAERVAYLVGKRNNVDEGKRITVAGTLRVIQHEASFVGGQIVPTWTEIRVEEGK